MGDFIFYCPHCNQKLECPDELENKTIKCPTCNQQIIPIKNENISCKSNTQSKQNKRAIAFISALVFSNMLSIALGGVIVYFTMTQRDIHKSQKETIHTGNPQEAVSTKEINYVESSETHDKKTPIEKEIVKKEVPKAAPAKKMMQISSNLDIDWSSPSAENLKGMRKNEFLFSALSPLVDIVEKLYPSNIDEIKVADAARCKIEGESAQIYISGKINNSDNELSLIIQKDDSDDIYPFTYYWSSDKKVCVEFAICSSFLARKFWEIRDRVINHSDKKKSEKIEQPSATFSNRSFYGRCKISYIPNGDCMVKMEFQTSQRSPGEYLPDIELNGKEFEKLANAILVTQKMLNNYHLKRFYWYRN